MAGIEHRSIEGVLEAFDHFNQPNFGIFGGRTFNEPRDTCCEDNIDNARAKLSAWLTMIENGETSQTYMLKCFPAGTDLIKSNTPFTHSTTFMLSKAVPVTQNANGTWVIDREAKQSNYQANSLMAAELKELRETNKQLLDKINEQVLQQQEQRFNSTIGDLRKEIQKLQEPVEKEESTWDKIGRVAERVIDKKPEILDRILDSIDRWLTPSAERTHHHREHAISGTDHKEPQQEQKMETENMTAEEQQKLRDAFSDRQYEALDKLEAKVGTEPVTIALEKLSEMSVEDLRFVFNKIGIKV